MACSIPPDLWLASLYVSNSSAHLCCWLRLCLQTQSLCNVMQGFILHIVAWLYIFIPPRTHHMGTGCSQGYYLSLSLLYPTTCLVVKLLIPAVTRVELGVGALPVTASLLVWGLLRLIATVLLEVGVFPTIMYSLAVITFIFLLLDSHYISL